MSALLHGLLVGVLLSALRAPLGLGLPELVAVSGESVARLRAGALVAVAALVLPSRPLFRRGLAVGPWLLGVLAGLALHGVLVLPALEPASRLGFGLVLLAALPLFWFVSGLGDGGEERPETPELGLAGTLGAALVGAGGAIALEAVARHVRLFSLGLREDDTITALALAAAVLVGYVAFGRPHARSGGERPRGAAAFVVGAALVGPAAVVGLRFLGALELDAFFQFLRRFGQDFTTVGTAPAALAVAGAALVAPGFAVGLAAGGCAHPRRLRAVLFGAAFGVLAVPLLVPALGHPVTYLEARADPFAWRLAAAGGAAALVGALLSLPTTSGARQRTFAALAVLAAGLVLGLGPRPRVWQASPWWRTTIEPELLVPSTAGLLTVEPEFGTQPTRIVTLDRRRLTPLSSEESIDRERLAWSFALVPEERRASGATRVLFVGQMTPARSATFRALPQHVLEHTVPWPDAADAIDAALFDGEPEGPAGERIAPALARARFADGAYDLVVAGPTHGPVLYPKSLQQIHWGAVPAPVLDGLEVPAGTTLVAWVDARSPLVHRVLPGPVVPAAAEGLQHLTFGVVLGGHEPGPGDVETGRPLLLPSGEPAPRPTAWALASERAERRNYDLVRALTARFAAAATEQPLRGVAEALALHAAPQRYSSPYDSLAQQIELDEDALKALLAATRAAPPDPVTRRLWESFAWLLFERREIGLALVYLEPVASAYGPWPLLERVVARAYAEFGEAEAATDWLDRVLEAAPYDLGLLAEASEWHARAGDFAGAAELLERADGLQPGRHELRRHLAMMWVRAGDPRGPGLVAELLAEDPDDEELAVYLGVGPLPPLPEGFLPAGGLHFPGDGHDHEDHDDAGH